MGDNYSEDNREWKPYNSETTVGVKKKEIKYSELSI